MRRVLSAAVMAAVLGSAAAAQVPQPFPKPQTQQPARPAQPGSPAPSSPAPTQNTPPPNAPAPASEATPSEALLGVPIYPNAQFITSYDAGHGQRYYLFGSDAGFPVLVKYYQTVLKTRGTVVFETPATQIFEVGRFDERSMAYPPGVTIKDYTWGPAGGYLNPKRGARPERFASIIQIVPVPPSAR
jgi:hypothetical protein